MNAQEKLERVLLQLNTVIVGKSAQIQDCVACLIAGGHLLIEDVPGVGKTTLAHALARSFGLQFSRVQFTSDLMPSDLSGVSIYERGKESFVFHPGPIFAQVLLADEINRASPKTQSALLEAMEEKQVTAEGETRALPVPFFVIATQNPHDQLGTYALPESQLDRFLMRISLGYPDPGLLPGRPAPGSGAAGAGEASPRPGFGRSGPLGGQLLAGAGHRRDVAGPPRPAVLNPDPTSSR
jgi:MoxR-like ATPase